MKNLEENLRIVKWRNNSKGYDGLLENAAGIQLLMNFDDDETIFSLPKGKAPDSGLQVSVSSNGKPLSIKKVCLNKENTCLMMTLFDEHKRMNVPFTCGRDEICRDIENPSAIIEFIVRNRTA